MNVVKGKIIPLKDNVLVSDMNFSEEVSKVGIILRSQDGKSEGIKPRWGKVWAVGPEQKDVKVGDWVCVEHGRWTRGITVEEDGKEIVIRRIDLKAMMLQSEQQPSEF
jgi:co-chaperonin GroES (HSP10)